MVTHWDAAGFRLQVGEKAGFSDCMDRGRSGDGGFGYKLLDHEMKT